MAPKSMIEMMKMGGIMSRAWPLEAVMMAAVVKLPLAEMVQADVQEPMIVMLLIAVVSSMPMSYPAAMMRLGAVTLKAGVAMLVTVVLMAEKTAEAATSLAAARASRQAALWVRTVLSLAATLRAVEIQQVTLIAMTFVTAQRARCDSVSLIEPVSKQVESAAVNQLHRLAHPLIRKKLDPYQRTKGVAVEFHRVKIP